MALKIKLKLGGGGGSNGAPGVPVDATSTSSPRTAPSIPVVATATETTASVVPRPKIKLVRSDAKANGRSAELAGTSTGSSTSDDRPSKPTPPTSTPRIVLKARPVLVSSSAGASPRPTDAAAAELGSAGLPSIARKEPKPPKPSFVVKPQPIVLKPKKKKQAPSAPAPTVKAERSSTPLGSTSNSAVEMPPPALPALARVKAEPSPAAFPPSPLGLSSPLPSSTPGTPRSDDDNPASDDTVIHEPQPSLTQGPPGPKVPAVRASAASGKKLVGGRHQLPFIDVLEKMLKELKRRDAYNFFLNPVSDAEAPGYSAVVTSPMDLSTMTRKARTGEYKSFDEFEIDARLVFSNCLAFNEPESIFGLMATKLGRWTENHLLFYRELVLPGTEADHVQPPTPATTDPDDSRATSQAGSPSRSRSVSMALSGDEDGFASGSKGLTAAGKPKRTGNGQLGKKRGPYRKSGQVSVASYFAPAPQAATPAASNQFVIAQAQGGWVDETGRIRGAGAGLYAPEFQNVVRWWEAGGKRAKTKKELSKIATRRAREEFGPTVAADGSRDLREDETLEDVLDALLDPGIERPIIESLPHDYLASTLGRAYTLAAAKDTRPHYTFSPPAKSAPLPEATYGDHFFGLSLPEAFSWARSDDGTRPSSPPPAPPPVPKARPRSAAPHDYGVYPFFTPSSISPIGLLENERRDFLAAPLPDPRRPACFFSDPLLDLGAGHLGPGSVATDVEARLDASRSLAAHDDPLRKVVYGGWVGEVYASSLETFLAESFSGGEDNTLGGVEVREWVDRHVYDPMFAIEGALSLVRKTAAVIQEAGGLAALDAQSESDDDEDSAAAPASSPGPTEPNALSRSVKLELGGSGSGTDDNDVAMQAGVEVTEEASRTEEVGPPFDGFDVRPNQLATSLPSRAAVRAMIRRMPVDRAAKAHLDRLGQLPIFLSSVITSPADFYAEPEPPAPLPPPPPTTTTTGSGKRRRSTVEREAAEAAAVAVATTATVLDLDPDLDAPAGWEATTLRTVGRELLDLVQEQEELAAAVAAPRKKTRTRHRGEGDNDGGWANEAKATRVRLLLLSLARRVPLPLLETLEPEQVELLFPEGPIRRWFSQLCRPT